MKRLGLGLGLLLLSLAPACTDGSGDGPDDGEGGGGGGDAAVCPAPTSAPIVHDAPIETDETWAADSLHVVRGFVSVRAGATLTVAPCATVELEEDSGITVAMPGTPTEGALVAEGDETHPIRFEGKDGARWGYVLFDTGASGRLRHVTFEGGGAEDPEGASLVLLGDGTFPVRRDVLVDHVSVVDSLGAGVRAQNLHGFAEGSTDLVVTESGSAEHPFPVVVGEHEATTLPRGDYTGNEIDAISIDTAFHLAESGTLKNLGVPYRVGTWDGGNLVIGAGPGEPLAVLTIEAGVRLEMHRAVGLKVELATGDFPASGAIVARGTAEAPVVFTSAEATPAPGDWQGLSFGGVPSAESSIEHARIEYTGADCGCVLVSCSDVQGFEGALIFTAQPPSAFVTDTVVAHASANAVVLGYSGDLVDFKPGVEVDDVAGCEQTLPSGPTCPNPKPACE